MWLLYVYVLAYRCDKYQLVVLVWGYLYSSTMANSEAMASEFLELKLAYATAKLPETLVHFNIGVILEYFIDSSADFRAIRESSYELFTKFRSR